MVGSLAADATERLAHQPAPPKDAGRYPAPLPPSCELFCKPQSESLADAPQATLRTAVLAFPAPGRSVGSAAATGVRACGDNLPSISYSRNKRQKSLVGIAGLRLPDPELGCPSVEPPDDAVGRASAFARVSGGDSIRACARCGGLRGGSTPWCASTQITAPGRGLSSHDDAGFTVSLKIGVAGQFSGSEALGETYERFFSGFCIAWNDAMIKPSQRRWRDCSQAASAAARSACSISTVWWVSIHRGHPTLMLASSNLGVHSCQGIEKH